MKVVYIAGPIRAGGSFWEREKNIRFAEEIALEVWKAGAAVICPHTMNRFYDDNDPEGAQVFLDGDLELMKRSDAILFIHGWEESVGSVREHAFALKEGLLCFFSLGGLLAWIEK